MAGHSKWHNIQHRKGAQDAKRGKIFTKLIREIVIASKLAGPDPDANPRLRIAIDKALSANMTKDTIQRAVKRGAGTDEANNMMEIRYEGYGPAGVALIVDCLTDNKNRTVSEVRHAFTKMGGNLGTAGSVAYLFKPAGVISTDNTIEEDPLMELVMEAGGDDVIQTDTGFDVLTTPHAFIDVKSALEQANVAIDHAEVTMLSEDEVSLDEETAEKLLKLIDRLEDLDDVQTVYSNATLHDHAADS